MNDPVKLAAEKERLIVSRVKARLRVRFGPDSQVLTGFTINVSQGGLFLESTRLLEVDSPLSLEFALPDSDHVIRCRGRVAWVNHPDDPLKSHFPPGMGIQFLDLTLTDMGKLRIFVKSKMLSAEW
jgi:uncharacterized protein (TIGR02266 family)